MDRSNGRTQTTITLDISDTPEDNNVQQSMDDLSQEVHIATVSSDWTGPDPIQPQSSPPDEPEPDKSRNIENVNAVSANGGNVTADRLQGSADDDHPEDARRAAEEATEEKHGKLSPAEQDNDDNPEKQSEADCNV